MTDLNCERCKEPMDILHCTEVFRNDYRQILESTSLWCNWCQSGKKLKIPIKIKVNIKREKKIVV